MLDRVQLKREAKDIVRNARASAYVCTLLYVIIVYVLDTVRVYVSGSLVADLQALAPELELPAFLLLPASFNPLVVLFVTILTTLLASVISAGYAIYHLGVRRGEEMAYSTLFDGFSFVGKVILLDVIMSIFITLGTILFVIPGVIMAYRYRFALYNLCENPEISVMEAMGMSSRQTYGHKIDLFVLDMTFFGWQLLCTLTMGIANIWVTPYIMQTQLGYFQQIKKMKGIGWLPPEPGTGEDGSFRPQDPFGPEV